MNIGEYRIARDNICIIMWSCPGNMPKYYPGLRDILPDRNYYTECLIFTIEKSPTKPYNNIGLLHEYW
jgi:hypothetical protein